MACDFQHPQNSGNFKGNFLSPPKGGKKNSLSRLKCESPEPKLNESLSPPGTMKLQSEYSLICFSPRNSRDRGVRRAYLRTSNKLSSSENDPFHWGKVVGLVVIFLMQVWRSNGDVFSLPETNSFRTWKLIFVGRWSISFWFLFTYLSGAKMLLVSGRTNPAAIYHTNLSPSRLKNDLTSLAMKKNMATLRSPAKS